MADMYWIPLALIASLCLAHALGLLFPSLYARLALQPRSQQLWQIATYHWMHGNWRHLLFNCLPLLILSTLIVLQSPGQFWLVTVVVLMVAGWGTWLFSTASRVAGASGLVFGYWGFIIAAAVISGKTQWTVAAALTLLFYSGLWATLGEVVRGVSWSGHFWGLMGGFVAAGLLFS
jgi:membrane associated rhomboid family serine protease